MKKTLLTLLFVVILFIVCDDLLMPWYVKQGGQVTVPPVAGKPFEVARRTLDSLSLVARVGSLRTDKNYPEGTVINQNPSAGKKVNKGRRIYLTVSSGEQFVSVPNLKGRTVRDARFELERLGLKLGATEYQPSDDFPENTIIEQRVPSATKVKKDVYVSVVVSQGRMSDKVPAPDLNGKTLTQAQQILLSRGLTIGNVTYQQVPDLLPNTVVDQFPRPGELVMKGQRIDLFVVQSGEKKHEVLEN